jgi:hypothetical protein
VASFPSPALGVILDRIRTRLLALPPGTLHETGIAANTWVATKFSKRGLRQDPIAFAARFKDGAAVVKALASSRPEILEVALWMLEVIDREGALTEALAIRDLVLPEEDGEHFDVLVQSRALLVVSRCVDLLPLAKVLDLFARGGASLHVAIDRHPELQTGDAILAALRRTEQFASGVSELCGAKSRPRDAALGFHLLKRLAALRHAAAVPALEWLFRDPRHDMRSTAGEALFTIGSSEALEALARAVEDGMFEAGDPNLPSRTTALRAVFQLDPAKAYDRIAPLVDSWSLPMTQALLQALRGFPGTDPRWAALVERLLEGDPA